jgi:hypothetical protein
MRCVILALFILLVSVPPSQALTQRQQLINLIFGGSLPTRQPDIIEHGIIDHAWDGMTNLARIDRLTVTMDYGLKSVIYVFIPAISTNQLFIWHEGHGGDPILHKWFIAMALERGYVVAGIAMPLAPINGGPRLPMVINGEVWQMENHGALEYLRPTAGSPMRYFIEPVVVLLNYTIGFEHISMAGLSGGGWTTTLAAAIDNRIQSSYPVSGSMPLSIRYWYDWSDWEQGEWDVYHLASYQDLYVMAADVNGRHQLQILNKQDTCCFKADGRELAYRDDVKERSTNRWDLWLDDFPGHELSQTGALKILGELETFSTIHRIWLPIIEVRDCTGLCPQN